MSFRKSVALVALAFTSAIPSLAAARDVSVPAACVLQNRQVEAVKPYNKEVLQGRTTYPRLAGATATIKAEPGLSAEWLRVDIGQRMDTCGLNRKDVRVEVKPTKAAYDINFTGKHPGTAKSVYEQVRSIEM